MGNRERLTANSSGLLKARKTKQKLGEKSLRLGVLACLETCDQNNKRRKLIRTWMYCFGSVCTGIYTLDVYIKAPWCSKKGRGGVTPQTARTLTRLHPLLLGKKKKHYKIVTSALNDYVHLNIMLH